MYKEYSIEITKKNNKKYRKGYFKTLKEAARYIALNPYIAESASSISIQSRYVTPWYDTHISDIKGGKNAKEKEI